MASNRADAGFRHVDQIDVPKVTTAGERTDDAQITEQELLDQSGSCHIAKTERTKAAAERGLEDVVA